ncbi:MAG: chromate transporter [Clostridia bacterium]|nr:chromate transporter [Clostridia bacterium]
MCFLFFCLLLAFLARKAYNKQSLWESGETGLKEKLKRLLTLFTVFFKIGAFTFGGGYAMIPLIEREVVEKKKWITSEDMLDIVAIAESTPGPIAINTATFVGYKSAGVLGAAGATLGTVLPSFTIIAVISFVLAQFRELKAVQFAFNGIRAGVLALIIKALWTMYKKCPKSLVAYLIMAAAFAVAAFTNVNIIVIIIGAALVGIVSSLVMARKEKRS